MLLERACCISWATWAATLHELNESLTEPKRGLVSAELIVSAELKQASASEDLGEGSPVDADDAEDSQLACESSLHRDAIN